MTAGLVVAILAGAVAFLALRGVIQQQAGVGGDASAPRVSVVMAASAIEVRSTLTDDNVELREIAVDAVPEGAVPELEQALGRITLVDLYPGEVILEQRLADPNVISGDGRLALVLAEDEVLMAFPANDLMSQINVLKPGDHVDLLFSLDFPVERGLEPLAPEGEADQGQGAGAASQEDEQSTFNLLQNVTIAAIVTSGDTPAGGELGEAEAILLTVSPQDALLLKYAKDAGGILDIVLRAPGTERPFDTEPVDVDYMINRYRIPVEVGR